MRPSPPRLALALLICLSAGLLSACGDPDPVGSAGAPGTPPTLNFTAIPGEDPSRLEAKFRPVAEYLSTQLGVPVRYVPAAKYTASVEMFKNGDVLLAWFGGLTGVQARAFVPGAKAIAFGIEDPRYHSYIIANVKTGLERSDDFPQGLAGKTFSFGSKSSTSGRLMPEFFIRTHTEKSPAEFFGSDPRYSDSHDLTCDWVERGIVDAGAVSYTTYDRRVAEGKTDPKTCRIIWQTPDYPDYNFTAHPKLETIYGVGFTAKLQKALLGIKDAKLLAGFQRSGFLPAENRDFAPIRELAVKLELLRP